MRVMDERWRAQLVAAHAKSQAKRSAVRRVRARLVANEITLDQALADPVLARVSVLRVLCWLPRWGPVRADKLLSDLLIWPDRRCGMLTVRECHELADRTRG